MTNERIAAIILLVLTNGATLFGLALPAKDDASRVERLLDKREAQIERREKRVNDLEDQLEVCLGNPIARGFTPGLARRAAEEME